MKSTGLLVLPHTLGVELQQTNAERMARLAALYGCQIGDGGNASLSGKGNVCPAHPGGLEV